MLIADVFVNLRLTDTLDTRERGPSVNTGSVHRPWLSELLLAADRQTDAKGHLQWNTRFVETNSKVDAITSKPSVIARPHRNTTYVDATYC